MLSAYAAIIFGIIFLIILFLLHFLKPELDPAWRMISEYEIGPFGWIMRLAFFAWGACVLAILITMWSSLQSISRVWFLLIVLALFGAGIFKTNPITDNTPNWVNTIHAFCGAIVILTFPFAVTVALRSLLQHHLWLTGQSLLIFGTVLTWIGMVSFFASIIISRRIDPSAGRVGPHIYLGWPNRFMVVTYVVWVIIVAVTSLQI